MGLARTYRRGRVHGARQEKVLRGGKSAKTPGFAPEMAERIGKLYAIEREVKDKSLSPGEQQAL